MLIFSLIVLQVVIFVVLITVFRNVMNKNVVSATKHLESVSQDYSEKEKKSPNGLNIHSKNRRRSSFRRMKKRKE